MSQMYIIYTIMYTIEHFLVCLQPLVGKLTVTEGWVEVGGVGVERDDG